MRDVFRHLGEIFHDELVLFEQVRVLGSKKIEFPIDLLSLLVYEFAVYLGFKYLDFSNNKFLFETLDYVLIVVSELMKKGIALFEILVKLVEVFHEELFLKLEYIEELGRSKM